jgi:hypothetical protein
MARGCRGGRIDLRVVPGPLHPAVAGGTDDVDAGARVRALEVLPFRRVHRRLDDRRRRWLCWLGRPRCRVLELTLDGFIDGQASRARERLATLLAAPVRAGVVERTAQHLALGRRAA